MGDGDGAPEEIEVRAGEQFTLILEANPTTGYLWEARFDPGFVRLASREYQPASERIGAGGREAFRFTGVRRGRTVVEMAYRRPWERAPLRTRRFPITIE